MRRHPPIACTQRRVPLATLALVLAIVVGAVHTPAAAAQPAPPSQRPAAGTASIEGSWSLSFPNEEATTRQLVAFLPGGVVIATNAPSFSEESAAGGRVHSAEGLGAWERLADGRYAFTVVFLYFDAEENNWGALTIDGVVTLDAAGDQFSGTFSVSVSDATGEPLFTDEEDHLTGSRIRPRANAPVQRDAGSAEDAGAAAFAAALRLYQAVPGPCLPDDPPDGPPRVTRLDQAPGAGAGAAASWRETATRGIATFAIDSSCNGGSAGSAFGRMPTGEWALWRAPTAGPGPTLTLPGAMLVCAAEGVALHAGPDPAAPVVGSVPFQGAVTAEEFVLTVPGVRGTARSGSGWYRLTAPQAGWASSASLFIDGCPTTSSAALTGGDDVPQGR